MINFKGFSEQKRFDCLASGKDGIAYTACSLNRTLEKTQITSDNVGICATVIKKITYKDSWEKVCCIFLVNDKLAVLHGNGASLVDFINMTIILVIDNTKYYPTFGCSYKEGFCVLVNIIIESITGNQQNCQLLLGQTQREAGNKNLLSDKLKYHRKLAHKDLKVFQQKINK